MLVDTISKVKNVTFDATNLDAYVTSLRGLSATQAKVVLSSTSLDKVQQKQILNKLAETTATVSLTSAEATEALTRKLGSEQAAKGLLTKAGIVTEKKLETGVTIALKQELIEEAFAHGLISEAEKKELLTTFGLTGGNVGLATSFKLLASQIWESIKAMGVWLVTTPTGVFTLIAGGLAVATLAVTKYNEKLEENRQKMIEAGKEASQLNKDLDGLVEQYRKLGEDGKFDNSDREQAKNIQQQINDLLGDEVNYIDLVNGGYKEQLNWLRQIQYEKAKDNYKKINDAKTAAEDSLLAITPKVTSGFNNTSDESKAIKQVLKEYGFDKYIGTSENDNSASQIIHFAIDNSSAESAIQSLEDMKELRDVLRKSYEDEISTGGDLEDFYNNLDKKIGELSESVTKYKDALSDYNVNEAVIQFNEEKFGNITGALIHNEKELKRWLSSMLSSKSITDGVRAELVALAKTSFPELNSAIEETTSAFIKNNAVKLTSQDVDDGNIDSLWKLGKQAGLTEKELVDLISTQIIFNNTSLNIAGKVQALAELATQLGVTTGAAIGLNNALAGNTDPTGRSQMYNTAQAYGVKWDVKGWSYNGTVYKSMGAAIQAAMAAEARGWVGGNGNGNGGGGSGGSGKDSGGSDKNKPDYEDPTEAIINRINLRADELAQQEEEIQNLIEIAELENDYKKQISLTNDLIATRKQRVEELNKANAGLHNEAEYLRNSNPWNEETWFDGLGNATEEYYKVFNSASKEQQEVIKDLFDNLSKYKKAYAENAEEIAEINKEILQSEKDIADLREENYNEVLDEIQRHADNVADHYDVINKRLDKRITKEEALLQIMQGQTDATSKLMDVQTEIDKAIRDSRISLQYLDKKEREGIFNEEDYNKLSKLVKSTQNDIDSLSSRFYNDVIEAYEQDKVYLIDSITAEYERQVAMKERELEIAQAQVDLTKKQIQLNNVLAEKNVKQLVERNGQYVWEWVADTDKVRQATEELMDAEAELKRQEYEQKQQEAIDEQQRRIDSIKAEQAANDYRVEKMNEYVDDLGKAIENCTDPVKTFEELAIQLGDASGDIVAAFQNATASILGMGVKTSSTSSSSSGGGGGNSWMGNGKSYDTKTDYMSKILDASNKMDVVEYNNARNNKIDGEGMSETKLSSSEAIKIWEKNKHADGTRYTPGGLSLLGEEGFEAFIDKNGHLIPITQPTIGNIDSGGVVFNTEQMSNLRNLWDLSNIGKVNVDASMFNRMIPSGNGGTQNTFTGGITINHVNDLNHFVRQLTQRIKTKSI